MAFPISPPPVVDGYSTVSAPPPPLPSCILAQEISFRFLLPVPCDWFICSSCDIYVDASHRRKKRLWLIFGHVVCSHVTLNFPLVVVVVSLAFSTVGAFVVGLRAWVWRQRSNEWAIDISCAALLGQFVVNRSSQKIIQQRYERFRWSRTSCEMDLMELMERTGIINCGGRLRRSWRRIRVNWLHICRAIIKRCW